MTREDLIDLDYGRGTLPVRPPRGPVRPLGPGSADDPAREGRTRGADLYVRAGHPQPLAEPAEAVRRACREPIGSPPLRELARSRRRVVITVSDRTRPVPNRLLLDVLLKELEQAGIAPQRVTVLVATGLHHPPLGGELAEVVGEATLQRCRVLCHDARDPAAQAPAGRAAGRTIRMNRTYLEADLRIVTGLIEPHFMAGYSGGRKGVCPGVLAAESILHWHRPGPLAHPKARAAVLAGNPVDREAREIARPAAPHFLLNVTIDRSRRITGVWAGDWRSAWLAGVSQAARSLVVPLGRPADIAVTSAGGYPLDATFYQAVKGIVNAAWAVRPGGVVILAASLSEGVGSDDFQALFRQYPEPEAFLAATMEAPTVRIDQWQVQMLAQALRRARVWVYAEGLDSERLRALYVEPLESVEEGVERALRLLGRDASILYLPEGPYVVPVVTAGRPPVSPAEPS